MPTAENAKLQYEAGQSSTAMSALTDSGDQTTFRGTATLWSQRSGHTPTVRPDGLITGGAVIPAVSTTDDLVDGAALTAYVAGALQTVSADTDLSITRPASAVSKVNSITITSGGAYAVVAGTDGGTTAFSATRGAAGGPPYIPTTSIEIAQVRLVSDTSAAIAATEIFATVGTHAERWDYPLWDTNYGDGTTNAGVTFIAALDAIHTGDLPKNVSASYAEPIFSNIQKATDFVPPENSHSVNSVQIYGRTLGSTATSLNQGTFTAYMEDGVTDPLVTLKDESLWFRFYSDRTQAPYILAQGKLGIGRTFPAGDSMQAACTISAESAGAEVAA